jgi:hypothetical protein
MNGIAASRRDSTGDPGDRERRLLLAERLAPHAHRDDLGRDQPAHGHREQGDLPLLHLHLRLPDAAGLVDVELSNHAFADYGLERLEVLRAVPDGRDNPFVIGASGAQRFMQVMENMLRGRIAQDREAASRTSAAPAATTEAGTPGCGR